MLTRRLIIASRALYALFVAHAGCATDPDTTVTPPDTCSPPCQTGPDGGSPTVTDGAAPDASSGDIPDARAEQAADAWVDTTPDAQVGPRADAEVGQLADARAEQPPDGQTPDASSGDGDEKLVVCPNGGDYDMIGAAIEAAARGATISVCPGTYNENLVIDKPLQLVAIEGPEVTIVDGGGQGRVLDVASTTQDGLVVEGFTFRDGSTPASGGAIRCEDSTLEIQNSTIRGNSAERGGGLFASQCALQLVGITVEDNDAATRGGGALVVDSSGSLEASNVTQNEAEAGGGVAVMRGDFSITKSTFESNSAAHQGGGLYHKSDAPIRENAFVNNDSRWTGGGLYVRNHAPLIEENDIEGNTSKNDGAGVYLYKSTGTIRSNVIKNNSTGDDGGGIRIFEGDTLVEDNLVEANSADDSGGGIRVSHLPAKFLNNKIINNEAVGVGGGMDLDNCSSVVRGGVIAGNRASGSGGGIHAWLFPWHGGTIEDVRIANNSAWQGGGIYVQHNFQTVTMRNLVVEGNTAAHGAGIVARTSNFLLEHSSFTNNRAQVEGGAISVGPEGSSYDKDCPCPPTEATGSVRFVVAYDNKAEEGGSGLWARSPSLTVNSSILYANSGEGVVIGGDSTPTWIYNDVSPASFQGMPDPTGEDGNIATDPHFVDAASGDFHLDSASMCVDAGDPDYIDSDGTRADMGRYGGLGGTQ